MTRLWRKDAPLFGVSRKAAISACVCAVALCLAAPAFAQSDEEMDILRMIYKDKDLVTPTRSAKPISQVAENITVITAEEIEAINAHTLTDVLYHVTGVQMDIRGGPGSVANVLIQGSDPRHVEVKVDGVSLNNLSDNFADIGAFPVQQIERIEIVKGPASSAWGSSLGGIINIITKSPDADRKFSGTTSAAIGERTTGDFRADASGTVGRLGYYLYGGGLTSDGLTPNAPFDAGNFYGKFRLQATERLQVQYTQSYLKGSREEGVFPDFDVALKDRFENLFSTLALNYTINDHLNLNLAGRLVKRHARSFNIQLSTGLEQQSAIDDTSMGGSAKLNWRSDTHNLLVGTDYDDGKLESNDILNGKQYLEKWALFANDTLSLGAFSATLGIRYDHTSTNGDFVSPSLGITYTPFTQTIFRSYIARGFSIPPLSFTFGNPITVNNKVFGALPNPDLKVERVWSYSVGMETTVSRYFWFKATCFLHDIRDVITTEQPSASSFIAVNSGKQRREGVEAEVKTVPIYNTTLLAGFAFIDTTDRETGQQIPDIPRYTSDLGIDYNDNDSFRGALRGHFIWWNEGQAESGKYNAMIWDMNLIKKIVEKGEVTVEVFFTAHNIFNGSQYLDAHFPNPGRWFEGGLRCKF